MREYDDATLKRLQKCELILLKDFVEICETEGLMYFGLAGTALGAVRHKGFIPWDDDIDLGLPRKDFDRLVEVVRSEYANKYEIMNAASDINYPLPTTRMMLKGTQFCEETLADISCDLGIFLDLYAFDSVADDDKAYRKQAWDAWWWSHVRILLSIPKPVLPFRGLSRTVALKLCQLGSAVFRMAGITSEKAFEKEEAARNRFNDRTTKRIAYLCDTDRFSQTISWDELLPLRKLEFEGLLLNFPANYEEHLAGLYGDYMTLPPEDQRKNHFPARLDFGSWAAKSE
ncbi:LicD family protein [Eggerthella lenta]|uniref:LicD family protein n=1 Tax=Eggerthella lenta (strain ATCC 25559 / DSM 2243 / CCUG 17323 / JCM 9979 / KCTC 3265 / NCTC 11813 / VPI 0255 / 1899 B) TaxID=479437 RepID=C8WIV7_EGGLE|nr:LicD family protein [Eggerthella lenta]ACV55999.1 LicD family protein [Eggerthella lenta DSM 2243]RDB83734.1 LicD family protein [Eggerthella lenta]RDB88570.1 LicD family protein [Eggerthella lenta]RDC09876.1 LicD family protein [Eggerthella lenta]